MSLEKAIENGHEYRKPYYGSKAIDRSCRNHGSCEWCRHNREYKNKKRRDSSEQKIEDYYKDSTGGSNED